MQIDQWNIIKLHYIYIVVIIDKDANTVKWGKDNVFSKW